MCKNFRVFSFKLKTLLCLIFIVADKKKMHLIKQFFGQGLQLMGLESVMSSIKVPLWPTVGHTVYTPVLMLWILFYTLRV